MSFLFGSGSSSAPPPPKAPDPLPSPPSFATGNNKARPIGGQAPWGYGASIMTGPMGADQSNTNVQRKSLLGQ